jgi:hypothetical protein
MLLFYDMWLIQFMICDLRGIFMPEINLMSPINLTCAICREHSVTLHVVHLIAIKN